MKTGKGIISARGIGDVLIALPSFGLTLVQRVMCAPDLQEFSNLLSIPQLTDTGVAILFQREFAGIYKNGKMIAVGTKLGKGFYLDIDHQTTDLVNSYPPTPTYVDPHKPTVPTFSCTYDAHEPMTAMVHGISDTQAIEVWHRRLRHLNEEAIIQLSSISTGINIAKPGTRKELTISLKCDGCLKVSNRNKSPVSFENPNNTNSVACIMISKDHALARTSMDSSISSYVWMKRLDMPKLTL